MLLLLACSLAHDDSGEIEVPDDPPVIATASVECDPDDAKWRVDLTTEHWTGGGRLWFSTDGDYVEDHRIDSVEAEGDGSADRLELDLSIVADWTDASGGSSTVFNCGVPELTGFLAVYDRDGTTVADCRVLGDAPERWADWKVGTCTDTVTVKAG